MENQERSSMASNDPEMTSNGNPWGRVLDLLYKRVGEAVDG